MRTLLIDNYDSYTFNLYQMLAEVSGHLPLVIRNDQVDWTALKELMFDNVVISPGPGRPENNKDFGICRRVLQEFKIPLLGVCLGHQGLGYWYGGIVTHAPEVMHGRLSQIYHNHSPLFRNIPQGISAVRYHSLIVADKLPGCLEKIAWTQDGIVMGLRHCQYPLWGVQFHPESICTEYGYCLLENFREIVQTFWQDKEQKDGGAASGKQQEPRPLYFEVSARLQPKVEQHDFVVQTRKLDCYLDAERVFVHLFGQKRYAFWLDSSRAEPGLARFSFMGDSSGPNSLIVYYWTQTRDLFIVDQRGETQLQEGLFDYLNRELARRHCNSNELPFDFNGGFVGYFGYELKHDCGAKLRYGSSLPDASLLLADRLIAFDHQERTVCLVSLVQRDHIGQAETWFNEVEAQLRTVPQAPPVPLGMSQNPLRFRLTRFSKHYQADIQHCLQELTNGETYEICLTNKVSTDTRVNPLNLYRILRERNPAPYAAFLRFDEVAVVSSSPERFLKIDRQGWVESKPIKGTRPRGRTPEEDVAICEELRNSNKDRAENLMIVDLIRNDLGVVCDVGSVHVPKLMDVETYATVHQLVSTIRGHLRPGLRVTDCIQAAFPGGSMTGAPKLRTMSILDKLEREARGIYSGSIGFLALNGAADLSIVIRTAVVTPTSISIGTGGAITALSDFQAEFDEMLLKAQPLIEAILVAVHGTVNPNRYRLDGLHVKSQEALLETL